MSVLSLTNTVKTPEINKSKFDLSFVHTTAGQFGYLIPIYLEEVVPGDIFKIDINHLLRVLPLAGPIAHRCDLFVHAFYVPNRIIDEDWEGIITGRTSNAVPQENLKTQHIAPTSIGAYYGIPIKDFTLANMSTWVSTYPKRGYVKIYNDYYRNKVIQSELDPTTMKYEDKVIMRNWRRDYFTSAVPYPQLGNPATVSLDITYREPAHVTLHGGATPTDDNLAVYQGHLRGDMNQESLIMDNIEDAVVNVNELRYAYAYQDFLVKMLHAGDHYGDHLLQIFGVKSSDSRLQKAEYLGGYSSPIIINDVTSMYGDETAPLGTQAGSGKSYGSSDQIECYVEEHGYIHIIASVMPKSAHVGGLPKHFTREVALDFYFPQFANLPEQEILNKEVYLNGMNAVDDDHVFGYIERYGEYKHRNDLFTGDLAEVGNTWNSLHFANLYETRQNLNGTFLKANIRQDAFAVANDIHFWGQFGFNVEAIRPMPFNIDATTMF